MNDARKPNDLDRRIGAQMRAMREAEKITLAVMADGLGISTQQLSKYENGKNRITASRLRQIEDIIVSIRKSGALPSPVGTMPGSFEEGGWPGGDDRFEKIEQSLARIEAKQDTILRKLVA